MLQYTYQNKTTYLGVSQASEFTAALYRWLKASPQVQTGGPVKLDSMWQHRLTRPLHVQHTYYCIIYKQNPFNIISRGVQR